METYVERRKLLQLPRELFQALGEVTVRYGQIEHILALTIRRTEGTPYEEAFAELQSLKGNDKWRRRAKKAFRAWAVRVREPAEAIRQAEVFSSLIGEFAVLARKRGEVTHCCWSKGDRDDITATRGNDVVKQGNRPYSIEDVQKLAEDLQQLVYKLNEATPITPQERSKPESVLPPVRFNRDFDRSSTLETSSTAVTAVPSIPSKSSED